VQEGDIICVTCGTNLLTGQKIVDEAAKRRRRSVPWGWIAGIAAALLIIAAVAGLWMFAAARDPISQAQRLAANGDTLAAEGLLETYTERVPDDAAALMELGRLQLRNNKQARAAASFARVSRLNPSDPEAALLAASASAQADAGASPDFITLMERAAELNSSDPGLWYVLALARGVNGDYRGEVDALNRVVELRPSDDSARLSLGVAHGLNGEVDRARNELMSVGTGPRKGDALAALGFIAAMQGDIVQAERRLNEAVTADDLGMKAETNVVLGRLMLEQGNFPEAQAYLEAALAADQNHRQARFLHGLCLQARGRFQDALGDFEQLASSPGPFAAEAGVQAADVHLTLYAPDRARRALDEAGRAGANSAAYHTAAGRLAMATDDAVRAQSSFDLAIRTDPDFASAYLERGLLHVQQEATQEGLADLDRYLELVGEGARGSRVGDVQMLADQLRQAVQGPEGAAQSEASV
jgi:tetratricopeptide (TPR) repeat protein